MQLEYLDLYLIHYPVSFQNLFEDGEIIQYNKSKLSPKPTLFDTTVSKHISKNNSRTNSKARDWLIE